MGPLSGFKFIEIAGLGPTQLCGMLLADMGAEVVRIERREPAALDALFPERYNLMNRGRRSVAIDLKRPAGIEVALRLLESADALFEGFRPGVMERLGLGPETCMSRNPRLVYGRMTGWGQTGPLAGKAGHDPNFIALAGVLDSIGERDGAPVLPLNLIGDFGGGALYLAVGLLAAVLEASRSGRGQVVDAAMLDGSISLMTMIYGLLAAGSWRPRRGHNLFDGGAHFHRPYRTKDGKYVVVGALEPRFYAALLEALGIEADLESYARPAAWERLRPRLEEAFLTRTRAEWCELFERLDACASPVLSLEEAPEHPHNRERRTFVTVDGIVQPAPAPRFDRTPSEIRCPPPRRGENTREALGDWGFEPAEIRRLIESRVVGAADEPGGRGGSEA